MRERKRNRKAGFDYASDGIYFLTHCCKDQISWFGQVKNKKMELNEYGNILKQQIEWMEQQYPYFIIHNYIIMPNHFHILAEIKRAKGTAIHDEKLENNAIGAAEIDNDGAIDAAINAAKIDDAANNGAAIGWDADNGAALGWDADNGAAIGWDADNGAAIGWDADNGAAIGCDADNGAAIGCDADNGAAIGWDADNGAAIGWDADNGAAIGWDAAERTGRDLSVPLSPSQSAQSNPSPHKIKSISQLMGALKTTSSKKIHLAGNLQFQWHRSFHDHIVKTADAYWNIYHYITKNPEKWDNDKFFYLD
jgi:REP element-mobilizing transposase RayT